MSMSQRRGSKEARKPKKLKPPRANASQPSVKGVAPNVIKG
ncbi:hypothetical protein KC8_19195 [Sphingomonas sp. KC8]|nr:hypothetical protein KC8_19195 [Sphingomonas sp. KC8]